MNNQLKEKLQAYKPLMWVNPKYNDKPNFPIEFTEIIDAEARLKRFEPFIKDAFHLESGLIESELKAIENKVFLKCDHKLPISGSIKARGGIYEILKYSESLLIKNGLLTLNDDYNILSQELYRTFLSNYKIVVSSTGNLGLSIGIISAKLGFKVNVHMSSDAMPWKKTLLRNLGVTVIEHESDYSQAVIEGRRSAALDPKAYFVDDENSKSLFIGYAVAALRLKNQLPNISPDKPLYVYIPCGVGGGPGGITYGLKLIYGPLVQVIFVEPTHAPCMLLGMASGKHDQICVQDIGLDNKTVADGLAVGRPSKLVGELMDDMLSGVVTVDDQTLLELVPMVFNRYQEFLEPSAVAGFEGYKQVKSIEDVYLGGLLNPTSIKNGIHVIWSTGGEMVPDEVRKKYLK